MPNPENVIGKGNRFKSNDEATKAAGHKGGINSGTVRRAKRDAREAAAWVLNLHPELKESAMEGLRRLGCKKKSLSLRELSSIAIAQRSTQGDIAAYQFLLKLSGEYDPDISPIQSEPDLPVLIESRPETPSEPLERPDEECRINVYSLLASPFWDAYDDIIRQAHSEYWFKGGRGSTKSSFISIAIILGLLRDPDANAIVYRRVGNTLRDSVYAQFVWAIDMLELTRWFQFRRSPLEINYAPTGQRILFRGADDPLKSKSIKLTQGYFKFLWFEELSEFRGMEDVRIIKQSVFRGVSNAITLYSYNPPRSAQSWVNAEALKQVPERLVHSSTYLDVPPDWLKEAFIAEAESLKRTNPIAWRNEYMGEVTGTGGSVFENVTLRAIPDEEIQTFGSTYCGLDFGWFPDPAHFTRCAYDPARRRLFIFTELRALKTPNAELYRQLQARAQLQPGEEIIADSAEPKSVADLRALGARITAATKGPGSVRTRIRWLQSLVEIIIDPARCPETAREFSQYEYERAPDGSFINAFPDANNHAIDAVGYALNRVWMKAGA